MKRLWLVALAIALPAFGLDCSKSDTADGGFTVTCKGSAAVPPPAPPDPKPVEPLPPPIGQAPICPPNLSQFTCNMLGWTPIQDIPRGGGGGDKTGFALTPGNPKVNVLSAGAAYGFTFTAGSSAEVGYGTASGTDSGMYVESWITGPAGTVLSPERRVVGNWQPFTLQGIQPGLYTLWVRPSGSGPLMAQQVR